MKSPRPIRKKEVFLFRIFEAVYPKKKAYPTIFASVAAILTAAFPSQSGGTLDRFHRPESARSTPFKIRFSSLPTRTLLPICTVDGLSVLRRIVMQGTF